MVAKLHLRTRRRLALFVTVLAAMGFALVFQQMTDRLAHPGIASGSTLFGCLILLVLIGLRRRISFLPLGSMSHWTQVHIHVGIFAAAVYLHHVPNVVGDGWFESALSVLFLFVAASGFYGLYVSRTVPRRLTAVGQEHRYDRIRWTREQIKRAAYELISRNTGPVAGPVLTQFYQSSLAPFFGKEPSLSYLVIPTGNHRRQILAELKELDRYFEEDTRRTAGQLAALVRKRFDLDYQHALQLRLRTWVLFHSVTSVALVVFSIVHVLIVFRFLGN
ncbi:MAG: hypothetical protein AAGJ83_08150 [Planctomycetota bacterium]